MSKKVHTHYDNLKVTRNAPESVIKMAHKALIQEYHPDKKTNQVEKTKAERITKLLNEARDILLDPVRRKEHDAWIKSEEAQHDEPSPSYSQSKQQSSSVKEQRIGKFIARDDGTAIDTQTGLMWLRFAHGQKWENGKVVGKATEVDWYTAFKVAESFNRDVAHAGFKDWRLPTIEELKTLIDKEKGKKGNYIDGDVFSNNPTNSWFWSSSPYAYGRYDAWIVYFSYGNGYGVNKYGYYAVRLVRGGQ